MSLRLHLPQPLQPGEEVDLPAGAARHVQVRRAQPGDPLSLFNGAGLEWGAEILSMGRNNVRVRVLEALRPAPEWPFQMGIALGVPANERMDSLVEKASELGVSAIQPLLCERAVLRLSGERAERRQAHWQAIAAAACEQCGRATVPVVAPLMGLQAWLASPALLASEAQQRWLLSPAKQARAAHQALTATATLTGAAWALSGPEGGLTPAEETAAQSAGFTAISLGPRVLRADTAPLALLAWLGLRGE